jgi:hypothetical protein
MNSRARALVIALAVVFVRNYSAPTSVKAQSSPGMICCDGTSGACVACDKPTGSQVGFNLPLSMAEGTVNMTVQTTEPTSGFTGACLTSWIYGGQSLHTLPSVCYSFQGAHYFTESTQLVMPAGQVFAPYWSLPPQDDSFDWLMTCVPHSGPFCPTGTNPISNSCCTVGVRMLCADGVFAKGGRAMPPSWDGYLARGNVQFGFVAP